MSTKTINRRTCLRTFAVGLASISFGRVIAACTAAPAATRDDRINDDSNGNGETPKATDQDEHVPGRSTPVETPDAAPKIPVPSWESRVKQLEAEQQRQYTRAAFARGDAGVFAGKENSHEPRISLVKEGETVRVEVRVEHVMGTNGIDSGAPPAPPVMDAAVAMIDAAIREAGLDAARLDASSSDAAPPPPSAPAQTHYITTIYLRARVDGLDRVVGLWEFASSDAAPPTVRFTLPAGVTEVVAYEWCTLHGLWKAPPLAI